LRSIFNSGVREAGGESPRPFAVDVMPLLPAPAAGTELNRVVNRKPVFLPVPSRAELACDWRFA